ncbi:DUF4440 domain-containing protein [Saccharopolyspora griseoalba]|uniref:DUF4440 domain-containing protein n=1 Tax=Saccharopolyspora griseoalba TaxID=1431848 RepID=A0ABW2LS60_9PSEU
MDTDTRAVVEAEIRLLEPGTRNDAEAVRAALHPDFREFGASGQIWDRDTIPEATRGSADRIETSDLRPTRLGPDAILLTYTAHHPRGSSHRTSVWIRTGNAWRLLHHQGTAIPEAG